MSRFTEQKWGYDKPEVDSYINSLSLKYEEKLSEQRDRLFALKNELTASKYSLDKYIEKDKQISKALIYAVEKADEIESGAKKIYELEIQRVRLLYKRWEELLIEVEGRYPEMNSNAYIKSLIQTFKVSINDVLDQNLTLTKTKPVSDKMREGLKKSGDDYIKNILNRMEYTFSTPSQALKEAEVFEEKTTKDNNMNNDFMTKVETMKTIPAHEREKSRLSLLSEKLEEMSQSSSALSDQDLVDIYLNTDIDEDFKSSSYAKNIAQRKKKKSTDDGDSPFQYAYPEPNASGFDLKEALNPTDKLDDIMKGFNFLDED